MSLNVACNVLFNDLLFFKNEVSVAKVSYKQKLRKNLIFYWRLESHWREEQDSDPVRIRSQIRIRNPVYGY